MYQIFRVVYFGLPKAHHILLLCFHVLELLHFVNTSYYGATPTDENETLP